MEHKIFDNQEITNIFRALGVTIGTEDDPKAPNISKLRYHKIIIMTDADVDGAHIRILLLTFFYRYMRELITDGHVYIGMPPLYRVAKGDKIVYAYDDKELASVTAKAGKGYTIQRYKGLGEMQSLAADVGGLKQVLSGVKTRGILGEIQLGAILEEILAPEQYDTNVATIPGSTQRVEYAIKMPGVDGSTVWLPIDSKFPGDTYAHLQDAQASGDAAAVENARHALELVLRSEAKDIREKYVEPPYTTAFGILFLPFEGLYAEVVNAGLLEVLQRDYQVNVAGPSTMAALLNSLQMGFKTLAIQKRSGEVWQLLGAVKTEFDKFGQGLTKMQQRLRQTDEELDKLIGVRSRAISRKLRSVQSLDEASASALLEIDDMNELPSALSETGGASDQVGN